MGFGVFGSQLVLAGGGKSGGCLRGTTRVYVLETDSSVGDGTLKFIKGPNPRVGGDKRKRPKPHYVLPELQAGKCVPLLVGIKGKLYALNTLPTDHSDFPIFEVYDPETKLWTALPDPPFDTLSTECSGFFSCAVVGTKILVSPWIIGLGRPVFCFDVAEPTAPWRERLVHDRDLWKGFPDGLVLDLEDDDDDKIMFSRFGGASIKVFRMKLSNDERIPLVLECVATMTLNPDFIPYSLVFTFAHLGGRKVCVTLLDNWIHYKMRGIFFTFEYSFLKSAASPESSHSEDPYFTLRREYNSSFRSFSAKSLGWRNVEYNWSQDSFPCYAELCGCAVL
jgi:hypothetical protein